MKHYFLKPNSRAFAGFVAAVVLAFLAAASLLLPDIAVPSVDAMHQLPAGLSEF